MPISGLALPQAISTSQALSLLLERKKKKTLHYSQYKLHWTLLRMI
jgi:hypothetical protein